MQAALTAGRPVPAMHAANNTSDSEDDEDEDEGEDDEAEADDDVDDEGEGEGMDMDDEDGALSATSPPVRGCGGVVGGWVVLTVVLTVAECASLVVHVGGSKVGRGGGV